MESAASMTRDAGEYANGQMNSFLDDVEDLTKALKDVDTPDVARVKAKVRIALAAARSAASDTAQQLRDRAQDVGKRTDSFVRDNPWQVVGIAAIVGLAVGIFASRRSDS